jgi:hypothetical protein
MAKFMRLWRRKDVAVKVGPVTAEAIAGKPYVTSESAGWSVKPTEEQVLKFTETKDAIQNIAKDLPSIVREGLGHVKLMFYIQFAVGVALLVVSIGISAAGLDKNLSYILGAAGGLTVIGTLISAPPMRLQKNRIDLSQWIIAYQNWYNTFFVIQDLMTKDAQNGGLDFTRFKEYNDYLLETMNTILGDIEDMCEFRDRPSGLLKRNSKQKKE